LEIKATAASRAA